MVWCSLDHLRARAYWDEAQNRVAIEAQVGRRARILKLLDETLAQERAARKKS